MAAMEDAEEQECVDGPFYLEKVSIPMDIEDDYQYVDVLPDDERSLVEGEEDFEEVLRAMRSAAQEAGQSFQTRCTSSSKSISYIPEVVDDYLRNFLVKMGMSRTLGNFQREWYNIGEKETLKIGEVELVPDAYTHNQLLRDELKNTLCERDGYKQAAFKAYETIVSLQKERDFHRLQYKRIVQEKSQLTENLRRLKLYCATYEPKLKQLNERYQATIKKKMLMSLERDRIIGQGRILEVALRDAKSSSTDRSVKIDSSLPLQKWKLKLEKSVRVNEDAPFNNAEISKHPKDSEFPPMSRVNPYLAQIKSSTSQVTMGLGSFRLASSQNAHNLSITGLALHPRKRIVASASDDHQWRLWGMPFEGKAWEMIMTGTGHTDWVSGISFHPNGRGLATASGDTTVRIWDFSQGQCILKLEGHNQAAWGCSFHSCGDFLASCSLDNTARVWDLHSQRCRYILRGHTDSVNSVTFLPYSNTLLTCSADKTLSLWDARTGRLAQTLPGHRHSCNHTTFSPQGDAVASCDSHGTVKLWDLRTLSVMFNKDSGPHAVNQVAFSPSGNMLAFASADSSVKLLELVSLEESSLSGHADSVQSVIFDHKGECLISSASDGVIIAWS